MDNLIDSGAVLSPNEIYRYNLWRIWETGKPFALFIGLNPSTADHTKDDPTVRCCKQFAFDWGYGGFHIVNLFGYRATKPTDMIKRVDPVGIDNDKWLRGTAEKAGIIVAAWGANGGYQEGNKGVLSLLSDLDVFCMGKTKAGHPCHPLYLKGDTKPIPFKFGFENERTYAELSKLFGSGFVETLVKLSPEEWHGPVLSGYGVHLVYIHHREEAHPAKLEDVKDRVLAAWQDMKRKEVSEKYLAGLLERYKVSIESENSALKALEQPGVTQ